MSERQPQLSSDSNRSEADISWRAQVLTEIVKSTILVDTPSGPPNGEITLVQGRYSQTLRDWKFVKVPTSEVLGRYRWYTKIEGACSDLLGKDTEMVAALRDWVISGTMPTLERLEGEDDDAYYFRESRSSQSKMSYLNEAIAAMEEGMTEYLEDIKTQYLKRFINS